MRAVLAAAILSGAVALAQAVPKEDKPTVEFHPGSKSSTEEPAERRTPPLRDPGPEPPFNEARGAFTPCAALHLFRLELTQRTVEFFVEDRMTGPRIERNRRTERALAAIESMIEDGRHACTEADPVMAEQIMKLRQGIVDHPDLARRALHLAPLGTHTAARASRILDGVPGILKNKNLSSVPDPCSSTDAPCETEIDRRNAILSAAAEELKAAVSPK